jgi:hypothetical protein
MAGETQRKIFGPKLVLETGNQLMGMNGKTSFCLQSTTDAGVRFVQAHTESGNTKIMTEGCLVIESGEKAKCPDDIVFIANSGGMSFSADAGTYRVSAEQIVLQADKEIVIDAPSIRIGSQDANGTKDITIAAKNVNADAKGGNIGDTLGTSNLMEIFSGGILGGLAAAAAGIAGAAGGAAGQAGLGQDGTGSGGGAGGAGGNLTGNSLTLTSTSGDVISITAEGDSIVIEGDLIVDSISTSGLSSEFLMADGSTTRRYIGVGIGSTPGGSGGNTLGENGDIWYTLC